MWMRMKAHRWAYTLSILATLSVGILIGTVISYGVKGKEGQQKSDATPLTMPSPQQMSNTFSQIAKQIGTERRQHQYGIDHQERPQTPRRTRPGR